MSVFLFLPHCSGNKINCRAARNGWDGEQVTTASNPWSLFTMSFLDYTDVLHMSFCGSVYHSFALVMQEKGQRIIQRDQSAPGSGISVHFLCFIPASIGQEKIKFAAISDTVNQIWRSSAVSLYHAVSSNKSNGLTLTKLE